MYTKTERSTSTKSTTVQHERQTSKHAFTGFIPSGVCGVPCLMPLPTFSSAAHYCTSICIPGNLAFACRAVQSQKSLLHRVHHLHGSSAGRSIQLVLYTSPRTQERRSKELKVFHLISLSRAKESYTQVLGLSLAWWALSGRCTRMIYSAAIPVRKPNRGKARAQMYQLISLSTDTIHICCIAAEAVNGDVHC